MGFPGGSEGKESAPSVGDPHSIPGSGRSPGERNDNVLQYSCLKRSLAGYSLWGCKESYKTEWLTLFFFPLCMGRCKSLGSLKSFLWYAPQLLGANILCFIHILSFLRAHHREWLQWWLLDGWHSFLPEFPRSSPAHHPWWLQLLVTVTSLCVEIFYFSSLWEKLCCKLHRPRTNSQGL